jgi:pyruvate/2-oxoglutarate dehydrogenase complex dihydrolipoamide dehydrogenase (E3) component
MGSVTRIVIIGGGPAGYEAALVAVELGAQVTVVDRDGLGGACVLTDCVPSKALIATSDKVSILAAAPELEIHEGGVRVDFASMNRRIRELAHHQSLDIGARLLREGITVLPGSGRFAPQQPGRTYQIEVLDPAGTVTETVEADVVLLATGGTPRVLPDGQPDGERILSWRDVYTLTEAPEHLVVVGSGVTGAEFASGYSELGVPTTLVSSRDRVLPGEDVDAAAVIEEVFTLHGGTLVKQARAKAVRRTPPAATGSTAATGADPSGGVIVELADGRTVSGSHALICIGSLPNTAGLGLENVGVAVNEAGHVLIDRVSRTNVANVYAAGDCTGVLALASVAAMQGRIAMWHALGEAVVPLRLKNVSANVFTNPEIATIGVTAQAVESGAADARMVMLPLATNARAKMQGHEHGFIKLFCGRSTGVVVGAVVVAPAASELIFALSLAVQRGLTVNEVAATFSVYPSLSGSLAEAARQLVEYDERN